jgi:hypothetical protein
VVARVQQVGNDQPLSDDEVALRGTVGNFEHVAQRLVVVITLSELTFRVAGHDLMAVGDVRDLQLLTDRDLIGVGEVVDHSDHSVEASVAVEALR